MLVENRPRSIGQTVRYWSILYRATKRGVRSNLNRPDRSSFDPPAPRTQAGDLIEIVGQKLTQLFFTVGQVYGRRHRKRDRYRRLGVPR